MHNPTRPITPLAAVAAGLLAGAVGTVGLDTVHYLKYRRAGGTEGPMAWEFAAAAPSFPIAARLLPISRIENAAT